MTRPSTETRTARDPAAAQAPANAPASRSYVDRVARRVLRIEGREQQALIPLRGSLVLSAVRCIVSYVIIPVAAPVLGWLDGFAAPLALLLSAAAIVLAVRSLRRVWLADWGHRWAYTAFILVVLVTLVALMVQDLTRLV